MPATSLVARDVLTDPRKQQILDLLTASSIVGRPYIVPKAVPAERLAALRTAFENTLKDAEFVADIAKQRLNIAPMSPSEIEAFIKVLYQTPPDIVEATRQISGD
jgi:tripartite-type tricarboxylate transporter receptor subunit TctC